MDATKAKWLIDRIASNSRALEWLIECSPNLSSEVEANDFKFTFAPVLGSACDGAREAAEVISSMARLEIRRLTDMAVENCRNTIEVDRASLIREVGTGQ